MKSPDYKNVSKKRKAKELTKLKKIVKLFQLIVNFLKVGLREVGLRATSYVLV